MSFPDLQPRPDDRQGPSGASELWAEATGLPDNGNNTFMLPFIGLGVNPAAITEDWLNITIQPLGPSITGATFVSLSGDKQFMTLNFVQGGADQARVTVEVIHSLVS